jgi:integrase
MRGSRPLREDEIEALLRAMDGPNAPRDRALVQIGANLGLRSQNLVALRVGDLWHRDAPRRFLRLPARVMKARRGHVLPLNQSACQAVTDLMTWKGRRGEPIDPDAPLFRSRQGGHISPRRAHQILTAAADRAELASGIGTHSLRKSMASRLVEAGVSLPVIMQALGHRHLSTTERYIGIGVDALENGMRALDR